MAALFGTAISTFADVQNIRLSGDIRIRGYQLINTDDSPPAPNDETGSFISQRTRVTVEADLEDHVLVVVTLKAEGLWGDAVGGVDGQSEQTSGAGGNADDGGQNVNRGWDVGINEAYVQFNEMFYSAATLKLGRQYLHYGRGLIISSVEQEYNYDTARIVWDAYPFTLDLVATKGVENESFGTSTGSGRDIDMYFVNGRYELSDNAIKAVEVYFGYLDNSSNGSGSPSRIPPGSGPISDEESPLLVGLRADITPMESLSLWVEGAYEFGSASSGEDNIEAIMANLGGQFTFKDTQWSPVINANYIYASGGGSDGKSYFRPWFDYVDGYFGYVAKPVLSNIHIFNLGVSVKPAENMTVSLQGYYYMKVDDDGAFGTNSNVDNGSFVSVDAGGGSTADDQLGWEADLILGYDYSKDVRFKTVIGAFIPEQGVRDEVNGNSGVDRVVFMVRGEVSARF